MSSQMFGPVPVFRQKKKKQKKKKQQQKKKKKKKKLHNLRLLQLW